MGFLHRNRFEIVLVVILFIAGYLRFLGIVEGLFAFTYDVGRDMIEVGKIVYEGNIPFIGPTTGLPGLFYGPWWYYLLVPPFLIGSGNPQFVAGFMSVLGLATVVVGYILGTRLAGKTCGLLFASILAFSPVMVAYSAQIWNPFIAPFLLVLILFVLHTYLEQNEKEKKHTRLGKPLILLSILLGFLAGLSIDAEVVYGLLVTCSVGVFLLLVVWKRRIWQAGFFILGLLLAFSPRILFELKNNFIMTRTITSRSDGDASPVTGLSAEQIQKSFSALKVLWDETLAVSNPYLGWGLLILMIIIFYFMYKKFSEPVRKLLIFSGVTILTFFIGLSFFSDALWGHYVVGLPVLYIFLFSMAVFSLIDKKHLRPVIVAGILIYLLFLLRPNEIIARYTEPPWVGDASVYRNQLEVLDYIYREADEKLFNFLVYTPAVHDYPYRYLFSWYGKKQHGYPSSSGTEPLLFVIIEPDLGYEERQREWLKLREHEGIVIKEEEFPSGIKVQTRRRE